MNPYFVIIDEENEYYRQVATLIYRTTLGYPPLAVYQCRMDDGERVGFLGYQVEGGYLVKSQAEKHRKRLRLLKK